MNEMRNTLIILLAALALLPLASCSAYMDAVPDRDYVSDTPDPQFDNESVYGGFQAIVTVKKSVLDTVYFQLNDSTTVYPRNYQDSYTHMERVFCHATVYTESTGSFNYTCDVDWAEPLDQGSVLPGAEPQWDSVQDVLDIYDDWMTSVEDGYLTVHYNTFWGRSGIQHSFRLLMGTDPANPYSLVLLQDSHGDAGEDEADGIVCFDINSLPDTGGEYIPLSLKWKSLEGKVLERKFRFKTRE
jgi:hypothetical protein